MNIQFALLMLLVLIGVPDLHAGIVCRTKSRGRLIAMLKPENFSRFEEVKLSAVVVAPSLVWCRG